MSQPIFPSLSFSPPLPFIKSPFTLSPRLPSFNYATLFPFLPLQQEVRESSPKNVSSCSLQYRRVYVHVWRKNIISGWWLSWWKTVNRKKAFNIAYFESVCGLVQLRRNIIAMTRNHKISIYSYTVSNCWLYVSHYVQKNSTDSHYFKNCLPKRLRKSKPLNHPGQLCAWVLKDDLCSTFCYKCNKDVAKYM